MSASTIPIIDISQLRSIEDAAKAELRPLAKQVCEILNDVGFFYVVNHGVPSELLDACFHHNKVFFDLPLAVKVKRIRQDIKSYCGYSTMMTEVEGFLPEIFDYSLPQDCKEGFNVCPNCHPDIWPNEEMPDMRETSLKLMDAGKDLVYRLSMLLGYGLDLENPQVFLDGIRGIGTPANRSQIRYNYYPAVESIVEGQLRLGEHTDFGHLTLVFVDSTPGLQVRTRKGQYIDAEKVEGGILVNAADLLQRWTGDRLQSVRHRVVFRPDTFDKPRYSIAYFSVPDDETVIRAVTGDVGKYQPVKTADHLTTRIQNIVIDGKGIDEDLKSSYI